MSWTHWPGAAAPQATVVPPLINPAATATVINPAPAVLPPGTQYSAEQWAQMQQQNWQQWAQWQQQFQQWQQQYGAQYQKSLSAMGVTAVQPPLPAMVPNTAAPPPLPVETKPPLPPGEPPGGQVQPVQPQLPAYSGYTSLPPNQPMGYNTAPNINTPVPPPSAVNFQNNYATENKKPLLESPQLDIHGQRTDGNQYQAYGANQNFVNRGTGRPPPQNWQQNPGQRNFNQVSQPPPNIADPSQSAYGNNKRMFNQSDSNDNKRGKFDSTVSNEGWQRWNNDPTPAQTANKCNPEELTEAEKKFDKQFSEWESQFQKWKEQNANHPDKAQYKEYEKKWETWRAQLLERREQMRRKRLGLSSNSPQLSDKETSIKTDNLNKPFVSNRQGAGIEATLDKKPSLTPIDVNRLGDNKFNRPPPNLNNNPLDFKAQFGAGELSVHSEKEPMIEESFGGGFLQSASSGGIPGLDLVTEDKEKEVKEDVIELDAEQQPENKGPDFDAISRGINSILGDQKLLSMLSMVSQKQGFSTSANSDSVSNTQDDRQESNTANSFNQSGHDFSNQEYDEYSNQDNANYYKSQYKETVANIDDQTRSSFGGDFGHDQGFNKNDNFRQGPFKHGGFQDRFEPPNRRFNQHYNENFEGHGDGEDFQGHQDEFDGANREFDESNCDNYNVDENNFNRGFEGVSGFERPNDFGRGQRGFPRGRGNFNRRETFDRFDKRTNDFERNDGPPPGDFNRTHDNFGRGANNNYRGRGGFVKESGNFNKDPMNREKPPFGGTQDFDDRFEQRGDRRLENFNRPPGRNNFNREFDAFQRDPDNLGMEEGQGDDNNSRNFGQDTFGRDSENFEMRPNFGRGGFNNFGRGRGRQDGPGRFPNNRFGNNFERGPGLLKTPDAYENRNTFNEHRDNFGRPGDGDRGFEDENFDDRGEMGPYDENMEEEGDGRNWERPGQEQNSGGRFYNEDHNSGGSFYNEAGPPVENKNAPDEHPQDNPPKEPDMWKPEVMIDYDHKTLKLCDFDVVVEPMQAFDYRHKPLNRIPLPQRPKWLTDCVKFCPEFEPIMARQFEPPHLRRYPIQDTFEPRRPVHDTYRKYEERRSFTDRRPYEDQPYYDNRKHYDERVSYESENRRMFDEAKRSFDEPKRSFDESKRNFDDRRVDDYKRYDREYSREEYGEKFSRNRSFEEKRVVDDDRKTYNEREIFPPKNSSSPFQEKCFTKELPSSTPGPVSKPNITLIEDILSPPGRYNRPSRIVIILRGPPGSGKTFLAKLIKDKEVEKGGSAPRILSLDDYFMVEQEKEIIEDGRRVKVKEMVYEYEECMEASYRQSLMKAFKKTVTDGFFNFIIVDNVNDKVKYFGEMWSFAKQNGFQVYICQLDLDVSTCTKRNIHGRSEIEIERCVASWETTPLHHPILDATSLIQSGSIPEVEMEEINSPASGSDKDREEEQLFSSKWDKFDYSVHNLAKLDGTNKPLRPSRTMEDYLQLDDDWVQPTPSKPGQKRVRWADLEERKQQEKMRAIGFVVGQTDWDRMMDPTMGESALTQTKYIERVGRY